MARPYPGDPEWHDEDEMAHKRIGGGHIGSEGVAEDTDELDDNFDDEGEIYDIVTKMRARVTRPIPEPDR